jgi:hypothetical protein
MIICTKVVGIVKGAVIARVTVVTLVIHNGRETQGLREEYVTFL